MIKGFNCTLIAYGQSGSGKTYSMMGPEPITRFNPSNRDHGFIYRSMNALFNELKIKDRVNKQHSSVKCSFIEVEHDKMRDLLLSNKSKSNGTDLVSNHPLKIKKRFKGKKPAESYVCNLTEEYVASMRDVDAVMGITQQQRNNTKNAVSAMSANAAKLRYGPSHWVMTVTVEQKAHDDSLLVSKLHFIDLAGSEMMGDSKSICKSLQNLKVCINALADKKQHIPFRESTLTHLLQDSLGGNTLTSLLITLNMDREMTNETISSARFGQEAQRITNVAKVNKRASRKQLEHSVIQLESELERQKKMNLSTGRNPNAESQKLRKRIAEMEGNMTSHEEMVNTMKQELLEKSTKLQGLKGIYEEMKTEKSALKSTIKEMDCHLDRVKAENTILIQRNSTLESDNASLRKRVVVANQHIFENERIYLEVTAQNTNLTQQYERLKKTRDTKWDLLLAQLRTVNGQKNNVDERRPRSMTPNISTPPHDQNGNRMRKEMVIGNGRNAAVPFGNPLNAPSLTANKGNRLYSRRRCRKFADADLDQQFKSSPGMSMSSSSMWSEESAERLPTALEMEEKVAEFSITSKPITAQLMEAYFVEDMVAVESEWNVNEDIERVIDQTDCAGRPKSKVPPAPFRFLVKIIRLIRPRYRTSDVDDMTFTGRMSRDRTYTLDQMTMVNPGHFDENEISGGAVATAAR